MIESDDRLIGDPVWELFPEPSAPQADSYRLWLGMAGVVSVVWMIFPPLAVAIVCISVGARESFAGYRFARSIPDKAAGSICALFGLAWGIWKIGMGAAVLMGVAIVVILAIGGSD